MIVALIFILAGIIFMIGTLIYTKKKNNLQGIPPIDKSNIKKGKKTLSNLWGIDGLSNQIITINKNQHSIVVELESIEYSLLHDGEKSNVDRELISIAQMIKFPIQFLEVKKQIELGEMLEEIQTNTINSNSNVKEYAKQIISHLENIQKDRNLFERKNYMIISSFNNRNVAEIELKEFYQLLRYHLLNIKVSTRLLSNMENVDKEVDKDEAQGNEIVEYTIDNVKNLSNVKLNNFTLTDYLPKEVRIQKLETGTYNENLKYRITYNTNKRTDIEIAKNLSTTENNIIDFTKEKLSEGEYVTSYTLHFGTVKIGFSNSLQMKVKAKVVEGLVDESTFINNVKVIGHYLEAKAEDKDDVPVKVYENVLKIRKVSKEYNQYTKLPEGSRINAVFELLDENKKYIDTLKVNDKEDYIYKYLETGKTYYLKEISVDPYYVISDKLIEFKFEKNGQIIELEIKNDNVNLIVDVEKEAPAEAQKGEIIDYTFNNIGNYSNTEVSNFIWGDKLPRQVRVQELQTGIWNEELEYEIQYITNKNTNWKNIGEKYKTTENYKIDLTSKSLNLQEDEYIEEFRLVFGKVKAGFEAATTPIVKAKINEDVQNNKIFVNRTYVTADYQKTELKAEDDAHTVIYTKKPNTEKELPKTGIDD